MCFSISAKFAFFDVFVVFFFTPTFRFLPKFFVCRIICFAYYYILPSTKVFVSFLHFWRFGYELYFFLNQHVPKTAKIMFLRCLLNPNPPKALNSGFYVALLGLNFWHHVSLSLFWGSLLLHPLLLRGAPPIIRCSVAEGWGGEGWGPRKRFLTNVKLPPPPLV